MLSNLFMYLKKCNSSRRCDRFSVILRFHLLSYFLLDFDLNDCIILLTSCCTFFGSSMFFLLLGDQNCTRFSNGFKSGNMISEF